MATLLEMTQTFRRNDPSERRLLFTSLHPLLQLFLESPTIYGNNDGFQDLISLPSHEPFFFFLNLAHTFFVIRIGESKKPMYWQQDSLYILSQKIRKRF